MLEINDMSHIKNLWLN